MGEEVNNSKKKIVIAEDNRDLCDVLQSILQEEGFNVDVVHDGFSLIDYLKATQDVDVIILDLIMPEKGGISVFNTVRSISPASRLIIYTGYSSYKDSIFAREADAFIEKTADVEKLIKTIKELIA